MSKIPIGYIIDDGGLVNTYHFHNPNVEHPVKIPLDFTKRFAKVCSRFGVKGKFSVVPMPACLGRLDKGMVGFTGSEIKRHVAFIRDNIQPLFSITPEVLTHLRAYDLKTGRFMHLFEDVYFRDLDAETMAEYISLAIEILCNVGLNPTGLTSPWMCGIENEDNYARAIGMAYRRTLNRNSCFYFLHCFDEVVEPVVMCDSPETGKVVTVPAVTDDMMWNSQRPNRGRTAVSKVKKGIDSLLSPDGRKGRIVELLEEGRPITLLTHWQSLFSDGDAVGLDGFEELVSRIDRHLGDKVEWCTLAEIAGI